MMKIVSKLMLGFAVSCMMLITFACSTSNNLYYASYTRVGIDASTDGAGIGVKNAYIHTTPTKEDGSAHDVIGTSDIDISYTKAIITEEFATGAAALCAATTKTAANTNQPLQNQLRENVAAAMALGQAQSNNASLIFGSFSSWSLIDLSWGNAASVGINFGYKRVTGVKLPIKEQDTIGNIYGLVTLNTTEIANIPEAPSTRVSGTRSTHTFATGRAAIIRASLRAKQLNGLDEDFLADLGCY